MPNVLDVPKVQDVRKSTDENVKRLSLNLSLEVFEEVQALVKFTRHNMTALVRIGLGLVKIAYQAKQDGLKLAVVNNDGKPVREIVIP
jgi:hypothetical protein